MNAQRYIGQHESQYGPDRSQRTRTSGCTWTSAACGIDATTGGLVDPEPDEVLAKVKPAEETAPATPGWSLDDARLAMSRLGVGFDVRTGGSWADLEAAHEAGHYLLIQGDSDRFGDGTCSGAFDGDHCIGVHPDECDGRWRIDDPICPDARYEDPAVIRAYAQKLADALDRRLRWGSFVAPVPVVATPVPPEEDMADIYSAPGLTSATFAVGTPLLDAPGGKVVATVVDRRKRYDVMGQDAAQATWLLIDDRSAASAPMRWVKASSVRDPSSLPDAYYNLGVDAAVAAALAVKR